MVVVDLPRQRTSSHIYVPGSQYLDEGHPSDCNSIRFCRSMVRPLWFLHVLVGFYMFVYVFIYFMLLLHCYQMVCYITYIERFIQKQNTCIGGPARHASLAGQPCRPGRPAIAQSNRVSYAITNDVQYNLRWPSRAMGPTPVIFDMACYVNLVPNT